MVHLLPDSGTEVEKELFLDTFGDETTKIRLRSESVDNSVMILSILFTYRA